MTDAELKVLLDAAQATGLKPANLSAKNPWTQQGATANTLQTAVEALSPIQAAKWRAEAGIESSLEAVAARAGLVEMTNASHQNLMETDADYATGAQEASARREVELLASMEAETAKLQEARGFDPDRKQYGGKFAQFNAEQDRWKAAQNAANGAS